MYCFHQPPRCLPNGYERSHPWGAPIFHAVAMLYEKRLWILPVCFWGDGGEESDATSRYPVQASCRRESWGWRWRLLTSLQTRQSGPGERAAEGTSQDNEAGRSLPAICSAVYKLASVLGRLWQDVSELHKLH